MVDLVWGYNEVTPIESKTPSRHAHALRVLIVEDHEDTAVSLALLLRLDGYEIEVAVDGPSALRAVQGSPPPDVVLLDIGLPNMDGWLVAKQIREQTVRKRPLLVAVTGYGMRADRLRSREAGIDLHLVKPVDPQELTDLLKRFAGIIIDTAEPRSLPNRQGSRTNERSTRAAPKPTP